MYIQTLRVSAAKELLEIGASSIQAVCAKIGYEDIGFFRNLFKRHTGMTPGEYRERCDSSHRPNGSMHLRTGAVSIPPVPDDV